MFSFSLIVFTYARTLVKCIYIIVASFGLYFLFPGVGVGIANLTFNKLCLGNLPGISFSVNSEKANFLERKGFNLDWTSVDHPRIVNAYLIAKLRSGYLFAPHPPAKTGLSFTRWPEIAVELRQDEIQNLSSSFPLKNYRAKKFDLILFWIPQQNKANPTPAGSMYRADFGWAFQDAEPADQLYTDWGCPLQSDLFWCFPLTSHLGTGNKNSMR